MHKPEDDQKNYRKALGSFGTGVAVVTAKGEKGPIALTINSFSSVSLEPPLILWSIDQKSNNFEDFCRVKHFAVHVLSADQRALSDHFAQTGDNKFASIHWEYDESNVPCMVDYLTRFQCQSLDVHQIGDHRTIVARVLQYSHKGGQPLLFVQGRYHTPGNH